MRKSFFHNLKRIAALGLAASLFLTGCGSGNGGAGASGAGASNGSGSDVSGEAELSEYVYVAEYKTVPTGDGENSLYNGRISGDMLYMLGAERAADDNYVGILTWFDVNTMQQAGKLTVNDLVDFPEDDRYPVHSVNANQFQLLDDGNIVLLVGDYKSTEDYSQSEESYILVTIDPSGTVLNSVNLDELTARMEYTYFNGFVVNSEGDAFLSADGAIYVLDKDGNSKGEIALGDQWVSSMMTIGGKVYALSYGDRGMAPYLVDSGSKSLGPALEGFPTGDINYVVPGASEEEVLAYGSSGLYVYNVTSKTSEKVLSWTENDIMGDYVNGVAVMEDGRYLILLNDWNTNTCEVAILTQKLRSEVIDAEELTLALLYEDQATSKHVIDFNKSQSKYHITIKTFYDWSNQTASYEDAQTDYNNAITGSNPPDLISVSAYEPPVDFASKGLLADLRPLLEGDPEVPLSDFPEFAQNVFSYGGRMVALPLTLNVSCLVGKKSDLGDKAGWTIGEFFDYVSAHPEAQVLEYNDRSQMAQLLMGYGMKNFVDFETGEVKLDTPEFRQVLELLKGTSAEMSYSEEDMRSTPKKIADGDVLMMMDWFSDPGEVQVANASFSGGAAFIGYPTVDGTPTSAFANAEAYSMLAGTRHPEGALAFIKFVLSQDASTNNVFSYGIPVRTSQMDAYFAKYLTPEYNMEGNGLSYGDDWTYTYHAVTQDEILKMREIISMAKPVDEHFQQIYEIIDEEAQPFYNGQKSVDEVVSVIQSRVSIYVNENR